MDDPNGDRSTKMCKLYLAGAEAFNDSAVPLPLDEESDLDLYAEPRAWQRSLTVTTAPTGRLAYVEKSFGSALKATIMGCAPSARQVCPW